MKRNYFFMGIMIVAIMSLFMFYNIMDNIPAADELIFIRLTDNLPEYESHAEWWTLDGVTHPNDWLKKDPPLDYYDRYNMPVWWHPPIANYLAYPLVKLLYNEGLIEDIEQGVNNLRVIAWLMIMATIGLVVYLISKTHKNVLMIISMIPLLAASPFYTVWGQNWFYHETFMLLFLAIALVIRQSKYKKYIYIPLALMVGCKITGFLFLIPFVIENRKTAWCSLVLLPYFIQCYFGTGDFLYSFTRAIASGGTLDTVTPFAIRRFVSIAMNFTRLPMAIPLLVMSIGLAGYSSYRVIRKKVAWFYPSLLCIALPVGLMWASCYYQLIVISYASALVLSELLKTGFNKRLSYA